MTLAVVRPEVRQRCEFCAKTIAEFHNGQLIIQTGKATVVTTKASIRCAGCGRWNHLGVANDDVVAITVTNT